MPSNVTPATNVLPDGAAVSRLVDGDAVNADNLYVEAAPGATKKLTLELVASWVTSLWTTVDSGKVATYAGTQYTIAAGTLRTFLQTLADTVPSLTVASQIWTGDNIFGASSGYVTITRALLGGLGTITDVAAPTITMSKAVWVAEAVSQQIDAVIDDTGAADGQMLFVARVQTGAFAVIIHRPGGASPLVTLNASKAAGAILIRRSGVWRLLFSGTETLQGASS